MTGRRLAGQGWTGYPAPVFDYAFGYKVDGVFGTTMSYVPNNYYLLNLSNPNLKLQRLPYWRPHRPANASFCGSGGR